MKQILAIGAAFLIALAILFTSVLRSSSIKYAFGSNTSSSPSPYSEIRIDYSLPQTTIQSASSPFREMNSIKDKAKLKLAKTPLEKSQIALSLADRRLSLALNLSKNNNHEQAVLMLQKSAMYLELAQEYLLQDFTIKLAPNAYTLALASLKQREVMELMLIQSPDEAKPVITKTMNVPMGIYTQMSNLLLDNNYEFPQNPFVL